MKNRWSRLDSSFVKDLTPTEIDDVFITRLLWGEEEDNDYITAHNMTWYFLQYPGLDTREKVYDKTWECIEIMMKQGLIICEASCANGEQINFEELNKHKSEIYEIMMRQTTGDNYDYAFIFTITSKGWKFLHENLPKYQPIIDEICRLFHKGIVDTEEKRTSQN